MMPSRVDPITAEVVGNAFQTIAEEMGAALIRSAYSTNIKERRDCSCAIFSPDGDLIALAEHIPVHLGSMHGLMRKVGTEIDTWNFKPGDVIITNDPYRGGGSHLPDITLIQPVFYQGKLAAFASNIAHWSDVGGRSPGAGTAGSSTEVFQEGLRIPPTRIISHGHTQYDLLEFLLVNMRGQEERIGDFRAQTASLELGRRHLVKLFDRYSPSLIVACVSELFDYSERKLKASLQKIPAGTYRFTDAMDDDGVTDNPIAIKVAVRVSHGKDPSISFDFAGTAPQASGGINMVFAALEASVYFAVKAVASPDVPPNRGFQRPIRIHAPEGCLVNAREPGAVGGRTDTCQRVVDAILGALSRVIPERVVAASNGATTALIFGGTKAISGQDFVYVEALGGGMGARFNKDGMDGVQVHITNTSNLPIEAMEMEYPLRILHYGLIPDSGGPGKFRGGMGIRKDIQVHAPMLFSAHSDRHRVAPWGLKGGFPGKKGRFRVFRKGSKVQTIPSKVMEVLVEEGDVLSAQTAGGGGFGSPLERDPENVVRDYSQGKVTRRQARDAFGVSMTRIGHLDSKKTDTLRSILKNSKS